MAKHENLYLRSNTWYYSFKHNKRRFRGSCMTHDVREAKRVLRDKMAEAEANPSATTVASTRYASVAQMRDWDFRRARIKGSSQETIKTTLGYTWRRLEQVFTHAGDFTADRLVAYVERHLENRTLSRKSLKEDLFAAKRAYHWAQETDPTLPFLGKIPTFKRDDPGKGKGVAVPLDQLAAWLDHLAPEARAKATVSLTTGIRWKELERFEAAWLSLITHEGRRYGLLSLPRMATKNRRARTVIVVDRVAQLLQEYAPFRKNPRTAWNTAARRVGVFKGTVSMRDLRHTFARHLAAFDWPGLCLAMGHKGDRTDAVAMFYQDVDRHRLCAIADEVARVFAEALGK